GVCGGDPTRLRSKLAGAAAVFRAKRWVAPQRTSARPATARRRALGPACAGQPDRAGPRRQPLSWSRGWRTQGVPKRPVVRGGDIARRCRGTILYVGTAAGPRSGGQPGGVRPTVGPARLVGPTKRRGSMPALQPVPGPPATDLFRRLQELVPPDAALWPTPQ